MSIKTPQERIEVAKKAVAGTALAVALVTGAGVGDFYLNPRVNLANEKFTQNEYEQLRPELVQIMRGIPSHKELRMWSDMANLENKRCQFNLTGVTQDNLADKVQEVLELRKLSNFKDC